MYDILCLFSPLDLLVCHQVSMYCDYQINFGLKLHPALVIARIINEPYFRVTLNLR